MRIKYSILWIDDHKETFIRLEYNKRLMDYVSRLFFEPHLTMCENIEEAKAALGSQSFDVIFSDYNISDSKTDEQGDDFIEYVREQNVNTEILFYSAMKELPPIHVNRISFFSFAGKTSAYQELLGQMELLIELTVKKLNDITALRGLVMAEMSELDVRMLSLIDAYYIQKGTEEKTKKFKKHLVDDVEKATKKKLSKSEICDKLCKHKWNNLSIVDIIKDFEFDSSRKARAIRLMIESEQIPYDAKNGNFYEDYRIDMLSMRNNLAHCVSRIKEGKEILITKGDEMEFDDEKIKDIRKQIREYNDLFDRIETAIP